MREAQCFMVKQQEQRQPMLGIGEWVVVRQGNSTESSMSALFPSPPPAYTLSYAAQSCQLGPCSSRSRRQNGSMQLTTSWSQGSVELGYSLQTSPNCRDAVYSRPRVMNRSSLRIIVPRVPGPGMGWGSPLGAFFNDGHNAATTDQGLRGITTFHALRRKHLLSNANSC